MTMLHEVQNMGLGNKFGKAYINPSPRKSHS